MSSDINPEMMSRNLGRVSGFGYRESIATLIAGATENHVTAALETLRADLAGAGIKLSRLIDQPKIRSAVPVRM